MLVRIANGEDPDLGLHCLFRPFWKVTSLPNSRTLTISVVRGSLSVYNYL